MKVTFKTITQEMFQLSINEDQTIHEVKTAIAKERGEDVCPVERQKLIYAGKILDGSDTFDSLEYDAKKFIVLIVMAEKKPVVEEEKVVKESDESKAEASTTTTAEKCGDIASDSAAAVPAAPSTTASLATPAAPDSSRSTGPLTAENQEKLNNLIAMGYPESEALAALRAAYFNQPRAVEYLISGIPDAVAPPQPESPATTASAEPAGLDFLQNNEAFEQIREMIQSNPEMLQEVIQQIAALNPALMSSIQQNQEGFLGMLNSDAAVGGSGSRQAAAAPQGRGVRNVREHVVEVTEEERDAINRLKAMGFPEQLVIEAYLACDKNEELAVDYIIARLDEFHL